MPFRKLTPAEQLEHQQLQVCMSPEHQPPSHIVLGPGLHIWVCPACGKETRIRNRAIVCEPQPCPNPYQPSFPGPLPPTGYRPDNDILMRRPIDFGSHPLGVTVDMLGSAERGGVRVTI